jgi:hypothetical protein
MHIKHATYTYNDYLNTQNVWNHAPQFKRQRMLEASGQDKNQHYPRSFGFIPCHVRDALINEYVHSKKLNTPATKKERTAASYARI